jgi:PPK2 family polyphosphate:nucleotide phosphotransferase
MKPGKLKSPFLIKPHTRLRLGHLSSHQHPGFDDEAAAKDRLATHLEQLAKLQEVFYAAQSHGLLIVLQGMDTAGKDGTIRHIFSGINPQGCDVASFKVPTPLEARHEFLWRCQAQTPARGMIQIFNRSHYEDVLSPRVHGLISEKTTRQRMDDINAWERTLADAGTVILKFFLHISRDEQTARLQSRIDSPDKHWKLSPADFAERKFWPKYVTAYEDLLAHTSHKHAPWFVIPADHKWFRNVAISQILVDTMKSLKLEFPKATFDPTGLKLDKESDDSATKKVAKKVAKSGKQAEPASDARIAAAPDTHAAKA